MTKLEEITDKAVTINKKIKAFEKLKWVCSRLLNFYSQETNLSMVEVMKVRHAKVAQQLNELRSELIPVNDERLSLLKQQPKTTTYEVVNLNIKQYESWMH
ncbi:hypothetical protein [Flavobacterium hungaricum]|uniref:Uncharacterized protein n=1 Tax=Flavobacterium hungaricum TaxID=2082725 RepID=A0ABR9TT20_9FLAO|nr:hypothetical protein [Flavobacterium hungaricum]MBE8727944.1 hypothetical protein [Flavobacterium hungaricum]